MKASQVAPRLRANDSFVTDASAGSNNLGGAPDSPARETVATVLPRVYCLAITLREYAAKQHSALTGQPMPEMGSAPQRAGLVGALQDIEDILRGGCTWLDDIADVLN